MRVLASLVCDHASLGQDGKLDVRGAFHDLYAPGFPAKQDHMVLVLVVEWDREDDGRYAFRVDLVGPDGTPTLTVDGQSDVTRRPPDRPPGRTRLIMPLEDVVFPGAGAYVFRVRIKGNHLDGPRLYLIEAPPAADAPGGASR